MSQTESPGGWRSTLSAVGGDVQESLRLRIDLAQLEAKAAATDLRRLSIGLAVAGVLGTVGLSTAAVGVATLLDGVAGMSAAGWLATFSLVIICAGAVVGSLAWTRFRRDFVGLEDTLEELREDSRWLGEILEAKEFRRSEAEPADPSTV
jgi:hypothetical protein